MSNHLAEPHGRIYLVRNRLTGKVYIGKTTQSCKTRWAQHCSLSKYRSKSALHNAIRKYGRKAFDMVEVGTATSAEELSEMESRAIWATCSTDRSIGYNLRTGGEGGILSEESKAKIARSLTGKKASPETRRKMSERRKAVPRVLSAQARERLQLMNAGAGNPCWRREVSDAERERQRQRMFGENNHNFGKPMSDSQKEAISKANLGRRHTDKAKENMRANKGYTQTAEHRANSLALNSDPIYKAKLQEAAKRKWADPEYRQRHRVAMEAVRERLKVQD